MGFRLDLHIHSYESGDNDSDPQEVVEHAIAQGLDGIAFTEHSFFEASDYAEVLREKANQLYQYILTNWPNDEYAMMAYKDLAVINIKVDDYTSAEVNIEKLFTDFEDYPNSAKAVYHLGREYSEIHVKS